MKNSYIFTKEASILIKSAKEYPESHTVITLSPLDHLTQRFAFGCIFVYPSKIDIETLKKSLSEVLADYPLLCGSLSSVNDKLRVTLDNIGVTFIVSTSTSRLSNPINIDELPDYDQVITRIDLTSTIGQASSKSGVTFQITQFACGSVIIGFCVLHCLVDGGSMFEFMLAWANMANPAHPFTLSKPLYSRDIVFSLATFPSKIPHPEYSFKDLDLNRTHQLESEQNSAGHTTPPHPPHSSNSRTALHRAEGTTEKLCPNSSNPLTSQLPSSKVSKTYSFTDQAISQMKVEAFAPNGDKKLSTNDLLSAHLARCITRARHFPDSKNIRVVLGVNSRSRLAPPLKNYFGNLVIHTANFFQVKDLLEQPLGTIASHIRSSVDKIDDVFIRDELAFLEENIHRLRNLNLDSLRVLGHSESSVFISNWSKFPMYSIDFGGGGPTYVGIPHTPATQLSSQSSDGICFILPSSGKEGGVDVWLYLRQDHLEKMENDEEWKRYCKPDTS